MLTDDCWPYSQSVLCIVDSVCEHQLHQRHGRNPQLTDSINIVIAHHACQLLYSFPFSTGYMQSLSTFHLAALALWNCQVVYCTQLYLLLNLLRAMHGRWPEGVDNLGWFLGDHITPSTTTTQAPVSDCNFILKSPLNVLTDVAVRSVSPLWIANPQEPWTC